MAGARHVFRRPAAADLLVHQKDHVAAVQQRNRQEVNHRQVDAEHAHEQDEGPGVLGQEPQAVAKIAGDMEIFLASDVLYSQRVAPHPV